MPCYTVSSLDRPTLGRRRNDMGWGDGMVLFGKGILLSTSPPGITIPPKQHPLVTFTKVFLTGEGGLIRPARDASLRISCFDFLFVNQ